MNVMPRPEPMGDSAGAIAALKTRFGDQVSTGASVRALHGRDEGWFPECPPDAVFWPASTEEVSEGMKICAAHDAPVIPFGVGTSLEGHVTAVHGVVSFDVSRMNEVLGVSAADFQVVIQPGVTRKQLNAYLRDTGLFFPVDPGADATLGGMAATRASGTNAVRYGTMRGAVLALEAVLADGRIVRTGTRAPKSAAGYDLTALLVGSEGTLGLITELTLRLHPVPEAITAAVAGFSDLRAAVEAVADIMASGAPIARIEFLDALYVKAINAAEGMSLAGKPTLFLEFNGSPATVKETADLATEIIAAHGGDDVRWAESEEERGRLWAARHAAYWSGLKLRPGAQGFVTDVCVPISRLAECVAETRDELDASGLLAPMLGHVGDGNFHAIILIDPDNTDEVERAEALHASIAERALAMGGTCTGEHGVGLGKRDLLVKEHGAGVGVMRAIKLALDPKSILNPGKLI